MQTAKEAVDAYFSDCLDPSVVLSIDTDDEITQTIMRGLRGTDLSLVHADVFRKAVRDFRMKRLGFEIKEGVATKVDEAKALQESEEHALLVQASDCINKLLASPRFTEGTNRAYLVGARMGLNEVIASESDLLDKLFRGRNK